MRSTAWPRSLASTPRPPTRSRTRGPQQERERLRTEFLGDDAGEAEQHATELLLDYSYEHLHLPLHWSPDDVALFLLDWVPRRVALDEHEQAVLPALLKRWVGFALAEAGVEPRWHEPVVEAVRLAARDFPAAYASAGNLPTRQIAAALSGASREDVQAAVAAENAARLARTALLAHGLPDGAALRLTVTLLDVSPPVWRRLVVPADVTLDRLARLVEDAIGWDGGHLHEWYVNRQTYGRSARDVLDERAARLGQVIAGTDRLVYLYDFGDGWRHEIIVEGVLAPGEVGELPRLEAGARACPPEDVGGGAGYARLQAALEEGRLPDDLEGWEDFDPERFDIDAWGPR